MTNFKILALGAALILSFVAKPALAEQAISEPAACAAIYPNADCTYGRVSRHKPGDHNRQRYASNYGWAEIQALRAFERMR
ncbi:hypothetical protein [Bradyrhizobium sp. JYMT SZCCT0428]|uniref:hypothetical protein n=1 Tax=Bradyrhizobium sp. JYMT SZCCT0428 TaxID=2807673 RepID=UPI001BA6780D|nr:hypothetical protein [Bradyrhizobium sp. JYMT SZCCT0428]MBR1157205.1 hypothetical protein [Bradyrhizobium sp. JYMT SZCCT0428]